jgi:hypothetical protein
MNAADVIIRLIELESAALKCDRPTIHKMLLRVDEGVLQLERLTIETLRENAVLRARLEGCEQYSVIVPPVPSEFLDFLPASLDIHASTV